jgi:hypothetical protein
MVCDATTIKGFGSKFSCKTFVIVLLWSYKFDVAAGPFFAAAAFADSTLFLAVVEPAEQTTK